MGSRQRTDLAAGGALGSETAAGGCYQRGGAGAVPSDVGGEAGWGFVDAAVGCGLGAEVGLVLLVIEAQHVSKVGRHYAMGTVDLALDRAHPKRRHGR